MRVVFLLVISVCAGCADHESYTAPNPTHVVLERADIQTISAAFVTACAYVGGRVVSQMQNTVECAKPMGNSFKENIYKAAATERYASNPDFHYQWNFYQSNEGVVANSSEWIEHQNGFGKTTRDDVNGGDAAQIMTTLRNAWLASPTYQNGSH